MLNTHLHISEQGIALIKRFEGFKPEPYICPGGYRTIGYGHRIRSHEDVSESICEHNAHFLLMEDVKWAEQAIYRHVEIALTQGQFDALCSFIYNVGTGAFMRSTLLKYINKNEHGKVPSELMRWVYAGKTRLPGLVRRRAAEAELYAQ